MDLECRTNVLALTERARSLLDRIDTSLKHEHSAGSGMVSELREVVNALRLIFPPSPLSEHNGNKINGNGVAQPLKNQIL